MNTDFNEINGVTGFINVTEKMQKKLTACLDMLKKIQEDNAKSHIKKIIETTINTIGLEETKKIIREINRELRER